MFIKRVLSSLYPQRRACADELAGLQPAAPAAAEVAARAGRDAANLAKGLQQLLTVGLALSQKSAGGGGEHQGEASPPPLPSIVEMRIRRRPVVMEGDLFCRGAEAECSGGEAGATGPQQQLVECSLEEVWDAAEALSVRPRLLAHVADRLVAGAVQPLLAAAPAGVFRVAEKSGRRKPAPGEPPAGENDIVDVWRAQLQPHRSSDENCARGTDNSLGRGRVDTQSACAASLVAVGWALRSVAANALAGRRDLAAELGRNLWPLLLPCVREAVEGAAAPVAPADLPGWREVAAALGSLDADAREVGLLPKHCEEEGEREQPRAEEEGGAPALSLGQVAAAVAQAYGQRRARAALASARGLACDVESAQVSEDVSEQQQRQQQEQQRSSGRETEGRGGGEEQQQQQQQAKQGCCTWAGPAGVWRVPRAAANLARAAEGFLAEAASLSPHHAAERAATEQLALAAAACGRLYRATAQAVSRQCSPQQPSSFGSLAMLHASGLAFLSLRFAALPYAFEPSLVASLGAASARRVGAALLTEAGALATASSAQEAAEVARQAEAVRGALAEAGGFERLEMPGRREAVEAAVARAAHAVGLVAAEWTASGLPVAAAQRAADALADHLCAAVAREVCACSFFVRDELENPQNAGHFTNRKI